MTLNRLRFRSQDFLIKCLEYEVRHNVVLKRGHQWLSLGPMCFDPE